MVSLMKYICAEISYKLGIVFEIIAWAHLRNLAQYGYSPLPTYLGRYTTIHFITLCNHFNPMNPLQFNTTVAALGYQSLPLNVV